MYHPTCHSKIKNSTFIFLYIIKFDSTRAQSGIHCLQTYSRKEKRKKRREGGGREKGGKEGRRIKRKMNMNMIDL